MQYYLFPPAIALHSLYSHVALPPTPETNSLSLHDALPIYRGPHPGRDRAGCVLEGHDVPLDARHGADQTRGRDDLLAGLERVDRKSTRLNSSHVRTSYAVFCLKKKIRSPCEAFRFDAILFISSSHCSP